MRCEYCDTKLYSREEKISGECDLCYEEFSWVGWEDEDYF